jgi:uncharacterized protein (DUF302 family)
MKYYISKTIQGEFKPVIEKVTLALKEIGFGVLTTIDVSHTLKEKIGFDYKPYVILGACNPHFASQALGIEDKLGVLLPCNVVVIDQGDGAVEVAAVEPVAMIEAIGNAELTVLATQISQRIENMIKSL